MKFGIHSCVVCNIPGSAVLFLNSHIFNVCGEGVNFICSRNDTCSLDAVIVNMYSRIFLSNLSKLHSQHNIISALLVLWSAGE